LLRERERSCTFREVRAARLSLHPIVGSVLTEPLEVFGLTAVCVMLGTGFAGTIALVSGAAAHEIADACVKGGVIGFIFGLPLTLGLGLYLWLSG
jgi:hypothetical protein